MLRSSHGRLQNWFQSYQGFAGLLLLLLVALLLERRFFEPQNLQNIAVQLAIPGILAIGMTFVIVSGGIDLSAGSLLALLNCIIATWGRSGADLIPTLLYVIAIGTLVGGVIGWIIAVSRMQAFIVTLAAMVSLRGIAFLYTGNANVSGISDFLDPFKGAWLGVPTPGWLLLLCILIGGLLLSKTVFGRRVYAIGGNERSAALSGVPVLQVKVQAYALNGFFVALAAILLTARSNNGQPGAALSYELDAISAVVVGGASLAGGYGTVWGSIVGAVFILSTNILLILQGVNDKVGLGLKGLILLIAVYIQNLGRHKGE